MDLAAAMVNRPGSLKPVTCGPASGPMWVHGVGFIVRLIVRLLPGTEPRIAVFEIQDPQVQICSTSEDLCDQSKLFNLISFHVE